MVLPDSEAPAQHFEDVVLPHLDAAYNLARWLVGEPTLAQDVVQDAALRALGYFATYRGGEGRAWFLRIVRNTAMTAIAARSRRRAVPLDHASEDGTGERSPMAIHDPADTPEQHVARNQAKTTLDRALSNLPVELREVLVLRELEGFSYRDIAGLTGVPIGTVMSRLSRARKSLADALKEGDRP